MHTFVHADIQEVKAGPFAFLIPLYGPQSNGVMVSLILCLVTTIALAAATAVGHGILVCAFVKCMFTHTVTASYFSLYFSLSIAMIYQKKVKYVCSNNVHMSGML